MMEITLIEGGLYSVTRGGDVYFTDPWRFFSWRGPLAVLNGSTDDVSIPVLTFLYFGLNVGFIR